MVIDLNNIGEVRNNNQDVIKRIYGNRNNIIWEKPSSEEHDLEYYKGQYLCIEPLWDEISGNDVVIKLKYSGVIGPLRTYYKTSQNDTWFSVYDYNNKISLIYITRGEKVYLSNEEYPEYEENNITYEGSAWINLIDVRIPNTNIKVKFNVSGNPKSIINGNQFTSNNPDILTNNSMNFCELFRYSNVVSAKNLYLSFDSLSSGCYSHMFCNCTELIEPPKLLSENLASWCYYSMFWGCTKLEKAPQLPATTLKSKCYSDMFQNCSNLKYIEILAINISASYCLNNWVYNIKTNGIFLKKSGVEYPTGKSGIPSGWKIQEI